MSEFEKQVKTTDDIVKWGLGLEKGESSPYVILMRANKKWVPLEATEADRKAETEAIGKQIELMNKEMVKLERKVGQFRKWLMNRGKPCDYPLIKQKFVEVFGSEVKEEKKS